jgi:hypothetical protein
MSESTSILDLPTDPVGGGNISNNISMSASENLAIPSQIGPGAGGLSLDQGTISQIVNGLQQASLAGATQLPSRDIPLTTERLASDAYVQPNYVPPPTNRDYIVENDRDIESYYRQEKTSQSLDSMYDELQGPLLLAVLYFLFQLPFFKKLLFKYLPFLCNTDGNYNVNGLVFTSALFGFIYYLLSSSLFISHYILNYILNYTYITHFHTVFSHYI